MPKERGGLKGMSVQSCVFLASAVQAVIAAAYLAIFWQLETSKGSTSDLYFTYATRIVSGEIPYRQFNVEYPLFALPILLIPRLLRSNAALV